MISHKAMFIIWALSREVSCSGSTPAFVSRLKYVYGSAVDTES